MIQDTTRFNEFEQRLNTNRPYHDRLRHKYSADELFHRYCSFVNSLPNPEHNSRSFNMFITTMIDFDEDEE